MDERYTPMYEFACRQLGDGGSHGMDHVLRVTLLCEKIGSREGANPDILIPAALLHDIARPREKESGIPHETEGARIASDFLRSIGYDEDRIGQIAHAIAAHRFSSGEEPRTCEARILSDADKLDAMGATGIARTFMRAGEHGTGIGDAVAHFHEKLLCLREEMYTAAARQIAEKRYGTLVRYLEDLEEEGAIRH